MRNGQYLLIKLMYYNSVCREAPDFAGSNKEIYIPTRRNLVQKCNFSSIVVNSEDCESLMTSVKLGWIEVPKICYTWMVRKFYMLIDWSWIPTLTEEMMVFMKLVE